jgi:signal transduction histidine kinase
VFSSLRTRLWLTYAIVVGVVLVVVGIALFVYLARNPPALRKARFELNLLTQQLHSQRQPLGQWERAFPFLQDFAEKNSVRVAILSVSGEVLFDTVQEMAPLPVLRLPLRQQPQPVSEFADEDEQRWIYSGFRDPGGQSVIVATQRPRGILRSVLTDELFLPLVRAGAIALLLSLLFAILISRWVASPLQRMAQATRAVAAGEVDLIKPEGPREVKTLARAFNEMNHQVQASRQSQRDFVANVSHELKTPLTSIRGFAQAILDGAAKTPEELEHAGQVIYDEAGRMDRMVVDLLDLARLDAGTADLERAPLELDALLQGVVKKFKPQCEQAQVALRADISGLPSFIGDGDRLAQVFTNLVDNAVKHTPPGGRVTLRARQEGEKVKISVQDTGEGIPQEELSRIFERFYQLDKSRRGGKGRGVGLGLAITQQIVHAHGGEMYARSELGKGSIITVELPAAKPDDPTLAVKRKEFKRTAV